MAVCSTFSNAEIVELDLHEEGDALITYDTNSGLEWLDFKETEKYYSLYAIKNSAYVTEKGFRIATQDELISLLSNIAETEFSQFSYDYRLENNNIYSWGNVYHHMADENTHDLIELIKSFGLYEREYYKSAYPLWRYYLKGYFANHAGIEGNYGYAIVNANIQLVRGDFDYDNNFKTTIIKDFNVDNLTGSFFLVRDPNDVSAPFAIGTLSLMGLAAMRRKRK